MPAAFPHATVRRAQRLCNRLDIMTELNQYPNSGRARANATLVQKVARGFVRLQSFRRFKKATSLLQRMARGHLVRRSRREHAVAVVRLQCTSRRVLCQAAFKKAIRAATCIQAAARCHPPPRAPRHCAQGRRSAAGRWSRPRQEASLREHAQRCDPPPAEDATL